MINSVVRRITSVTTHDVNIKHERYLVHVNV